MSELLIRCACGNRIRLRLDHAGKSGRCPRCGAGLAVPAAEMFDPHAGRELSAAELAVLADPGPWRPGTVVDGRYEVRRLLGAGTFGAVWQARHKEWGIDLAVKELRTDKKAGEQRRRVFLRECQAWIDLGLHPHVITAWYVRELDGTPYLFLEYCDGGSLAEWIDQGKTRELATALDIGIQLCWGLAHCHSKGIVHRDFKPLNVLMTQDGTAKLTDFGTVKYAAQELAAEVAQPGVVEDLRRTIWRSAAGDAAVHAAGAVGERRSRRCAGRLLCPRGNAPRTVHRHPPRQAGRTNAC
ncbi:MAG: protein kinase [Planctomycetes bacterium]|nr:protein kinase [Planctomycetota bacterium]